MSIVQVELQCYQFTTEKVSEDLYNYIRDLFLPLHEEFPLYSELNERQYRVGTGGAHLDLSHDFFTLVPHHLYTINALKYLRPAHFLGRAIEKDSSLEHFKKVNQGAIHVHLPGHYELLSTRTVICLDNCCTDELNKHLKKGWRIIAICPQAGQRRPDYILGRNKYEED